MAVRSEDPGAHTWQMAAGYDLGGRFDDEISRAITRLIATLGPGSQLPNERELAAQLGVSRNALRDRIRLLESAGILSRRQGSGTYVEETVSPEGLTMSLDLLVATDQMSLHDLHQVRIALETRAAVLACAPPGPDAETRAGLSACIEAMGRDFGQPEVAGHDLEFHRLLFVACRNPALQFFASALHAVFTRAIYLGTHNWQVHNTGRNLLLAVHQDILEAIVAGDAGAATRAVDAHFRIHSEITGAAGGSGVQLSTVGTGTGDS